MAGVLLALGFGAYKFVETRRSHVALDPGTYCPEEGPRSVTAIIIDATDSLTLVQRTDLANQIERRIAEVPRFGVLEIYAVSPVEDEPPQPIFRKCNPGRGGEVSSLTANPAMVERDWREGFQGPLEAVLGRMLSPGEADTSPILDSIQWVAVNSLAPPDRSGLARRLVLVSDLLQHSSELSFYGGVVDFAAFKDTPYYRKARAPLQGVAVDVLMVRRITRRGVQGQKLNRFWKEYFDAQGAMSLRIVNLSG